MIKTPNHRSLHIGINRYGSGADLAGCVADAHAWMDACTAHGFTESRLLLDGEATRQNMLADMTTLVGSAKYGDRVVITYSGHGTWVPDLDGDERDRRDEAICPVDFRTAGVITDDQLYEINRSAARGVRVVYVMDSCFSGTLQRFAPPVHVPPSELPPLSEQLETGPQVGWVVSPRRVRFLPPAAFLPPSDLYAARVAERAPLGGKFRRSALVMSACADTQVTYDAVINGKPCGIFTYVALATLDAIERQNAELPPGDPPRYRDWHRGIRQILPSVDYPDVTPQLDGTSDQKRWAVLS